MAFTGAEGSSVLLTQIAFLLDLAPSILHSTGLVIVLVCISRVAEAFPTGPKLFLKSMPASPPKFGVVLPRVTSLVGRCLVTTDIFK